MKRQHKPKPKPAYQVGQILSMVRFVAPDFYSGAWVSIVKVQEATFDSRYLVRLPNGREGWVSESDLGYPLGVQ